VVAFDITEFSMDTTKSAYLDTRATADRTSLSVSYLNQARLRGDGPPFIRVGRRVLYSIGELDAWLAARTRTSTSEAP